MTDKITYRGKKYEKFGRYLGKIGKTEAKQDAALMRRKGVSVVSRIGVNNRGEEFIVLYARGSYTKSGRTIKYG